MSNLLTDLELDDALANAPFSELHHRTVNCPIAQVWPACLAVTAGEIRTLGPLLSLRGLPARLRRRRPPSSNGPASFLEAFAAEGFVLLRQDAHPSDGRAVTLFGATGKFWSITHNRPIQFDSPKAFLDFDTPGYATTVGRLAGC